MEGTVNFEARKQRQYGLRYRINESEPYSGSVQRMYFRSEQIWFLAFFKDGKLDGLATQ